MKYGYARVSTDGQSVAAQVDQLTQAGAEKIFREKISGAVTHRQQLKRALDALDEGDVLVVTRLDRLARTPGHFGRLEEASCASRKCISADLHFAGRRWSPPNPRCGNEENTEPDAVMYVRNTY
jgi:predicted site-specific integrase-resolvase